MKKEGMLTINDIALKANVAKSTVSRFLNDGSVSPKTAAKIKKIIDETGYRPNMFAKSLKAKKSGLIGVIIPRLGSVATDTVVQSLDRYLRETENRLLIVNTEQLVSRELEAIETFAKQKVDFIVLLATTLTEEHYQLMDKVEVPIIVVGQKSERTLSVSYDDYMAGQLIGKHILSSRMKKVLFVGVSDVDKAVGIDRKLGVYDALGTDKTIDVEFVETTFQLFDAYRMAKRILPDHKIYIAAATDNIALGFLKAIYEKERRVPQDFLLSGFGGYDSVWAVHPALTTIKYPYEKAGQVVSEMISGKCLQSVVLPVSLSVHESTKSL